MLHLKIKDAANMMKMNSKFGKYFKCVQFRVHYNVNEIIDLVAVIFCNVLKFVNELAISNNILVGRVENRNTFLDNMNDFRLYVTHLLKILFKIT